MPTKLKLTMLAAATVVTLLAGTRRACAEEARKPSLLPRFPSSFLSGSRLGGLWGKGEAFGWKSLGLGLYDLRLAARRENPNRFFQLVKLFIDDLQVGAIGDYKLKLSVEIK